MCKHHNCSCDLQHVPVVWGAIEYSKGRPRPGQLQINKSINQFNVYYSN